MSVKRCEARLARGKKADGISVLTFEPVSEQAKPALFFVPYRCEQEVRGDGALCVNCFTREEKTRANLEKARKPDGTLKYVVNQETLVHGLVTEAIPVWSHMYKSGWFEQFRVANSLRLSEATLRRAEEAWNIAHKGVVVPNPSQEGLMPRAKKAPAPSLPIPPPPMDTHPIATPPTKPTTTRKPKKTVGVRVDPPLVTQPAQPVAAPLVAAPVLAPKVKQPKRTQAKASSPATSTAPIGIIRGPIRDAITTVKILVKRIELDGRTYYLDPKKEKVYDTKYNYIGRYNAREELIDTSYPDSDLE